RPEPCFRAEIRRTGPAAPARPDRSGRALAQTAVPARRMPWRAPGRGRCSSVRLGWGHDEVAPVAQGVRNWSRSGEVFDLQPRQQSEIAGNRLSIDLLDAHWNLSKRDPRDPVQPLRL